jgi:dUTP pyrophosphatase
MDRVKIVCHRVRGKKELDIPLPKYMTPHSSGMDLFAAIEEEVVLQPGQRRLITTGIAIALPEGYEAQLRPRSGLALEKGVTILNSPGTIDSDYRGEIGIILINLGEAPFAVQRGDRIAQMVIQKIMKADLYLRNSLDQTERNKGGFGHTGLR